jgi:hypothetical protein
VNKFKRYAVKTQSVCGTVPEAASQIGVTRGRSSNLSDYKLPVFFFLATHQLLPSLFLFRGWCRSLRGCIIFPFMVSLFLFIYLGSILPRAYDEYEFTYQAQQSEGLDTPLLIPFCNSDSLSPVAFFLITLHLANDRLLRLLQYDSPLIWSIFHSLCTMSMPTPSMLSS